VHDSERTGMWVNRMSLHKLIVTLFHDENQRTDW
jgi:hypothetical protein